MRNLLLLVVPLALGCSETCALPQDVVNGKSWDAFLNLVGFGAELDPAFPAGTSPLNGPHVYQIEWLQTTLESPVTVTVDDQVFEGQGAFSESNCGHFAVSWNGIYVGEDGSEHAVGVAMDLVQWGTALDGFFSFESTWQARDGTIGDASGDGQVTATSL